MARTISSITLAVSFSWWLMPYLRAVAIVGRTIGVAPTEEHLHRVIRRGTHVRVTEA